MHTIVNMHVLPPATAAELAQLTQLQRVRSVAGVAVVARDPDEPADGDEDRFCACGNLLLEGLLACAECEPVGAMHRRYEGTWRIGLAAGGCA